MNLTGIATSECIFGFFCDIKKNYNYKKKKKKR